MPAAAKFNPRQIMMDNAFEAFYYQTTALKSVKPHRHAFYEIYLFESGDITYNAGGKQYTLLPGDILLLPPQEAHHPVFNSFGATYSRLVLWISDLFIKNAKESCNCNFALPFDMASEHGVHLMRLAPAVRNGLFQAVYDMAIAKDGSYARAQNNVLLLSFLIKLNQIYANFAAQKAEKDPFSSHLVKIIDYIVNNFERPITLEEVADECFLSKYYLAHGFKKTMGLTVHQYITMRRMYRARQMLLAGVKPGKVALRCGFMDYSAFYRVFVKEYGLPPKAFACKGPML